MVLPVTPVFVFYVNQLLLTEFLFCGTLTIELEFCPEPFLMFEFTWTFPTFLFLSLTKHDFYVDIFALMGYTIIRG